MSEIEKLENLLVTLFNKLINNYDYNKKTIRITNFITGKIYELELTNCYSCNCKPESNHEYGCTIERCPFCYDQLITCGCYRCRLELPEYLKTYLAHKRLKWSGIYPSTVEAIENNNFIREVLDEKGNFKGWEKVKEDDADARLNLHLTGKLICMRIIKRSKYFG